MKKITGRLSPISFCSALVAAGCCAAAGMSVSLMPRPARACPLAPAPETPRGDRSASSAIELAHRASAYLAAGDANNALVMLAAAEKIDPGNTNGELTGIYSAMGKVFYDANRFSTAIVFFQRVANTGKTYEERSAGRLQIAICRALMKDYSGARSASLSVKNDPDAPLLLRQKAQKLIGVIGSMEKH